MAGRVRRDGEAGLGREWRGELVNGRFCRSGDICIYDFHLRRC